MEVSKKYWHIRLILCRSKVLRNTDDTHKTRDSSGQWFHFAVQLATCPQPSGADVNNWGWAFYQNFIDWSLINSDLSVSLAVAKYSLLDAISITNGTCFENMIDVLSIIKVQLSFQDSLFITDVAWVIEE